MEGSQLINFDRFPLLTLSLLFYHYCSCCNLCVFNGNPDCAKLCSRRVSGHRSVSFLITMHVSAERRCAVSSSVKWMISAGKTMQ